MRALTPRERALTPRERAVATLAGEGLPDRAIADRLCIEPCTVRNTLAAVYDKLPETRTRRRRVRLAAWLYRQERDARAATREETT